MKLDKQIFIEEIEDEIIRYLDKGNAVFIESGAANDRIISYSIKHSKRYAWQSWTEREVIFETSACIFPKKINLDSYEELDLEEWKGNLFVRAK